MRRVAARAAGGEGPFPQATKKPGLAGLQYILIKLAPRDGLDSFAGSETGRAERARRVRATDGAHPPPTKATPGGSANEDW